jgi:hypothetical protein
VNGFRWKIFWTYNSRRILGIRSKRIPMFISRERKPELGRGRAHMTAPFAPTIIQASIRDVLDVLDVLEILAILAIVPPRKLLAAQCKAIQPSRSILWGSKSYFPRSPWTAMLDPFDAAWWRQFRPCSSRARRSAPCLNQLSII